MTPETDENGSENVRIYFAVATAILLSILFTVMIGLVGKGIRSS